MPDTQAAQKIAVRLVLFADLKRFLPKGHDGPLTFSLAPGATVATLMAEAGVPEEGEITIGLNGDEAQLDSALSDGDEVVIFSPMEGG
ncbi:MAG: MoaD/ThiS family protein [Dehalococcoidia bacterium]